MGVGIGTDLMLLAIDDKRGKIRSGRLLALALAAAELVELAAAGCVGLSGGHLTVQQMNGARTSARVVEPPCTLPGGDLD